MGNRNLKKMFGVNCICGFSVATWKPLYGKIANRSSQSRDNMQRITSLLTTGLYRSHIQNNFIILSFIKCSLFISEVFLIYDICLLV